MTANTNQLLLTPIDALAQRYNWSAGLRADIAGICADSRRKLLFVSRVAHDVSLDGDALLEYEHHPEASGGLHFYTARWTDEAQERGHGGASVKIVHPDYADQPMGFVLSMYAPARMRMRDLAASGIPAAPPVHGVLTDEATLGR